MLCTYYSTLETLRIRQHSKHTVTIEKQISRIPGNVQRKTSTRIEMFFNLFLHPRPKSNRRFSVDGRNKDIKFHLKMK